MRDKMLAYLIFVYFVGILYAILQSLWYGMDIGSLLGFSYSPSPNLLDSIVNGISAGFNLVITLAQLPMRIPLPEPFKTVWTASILLTVIYLSSEAIRSWVEALVP